MANRDLELLLVCLTSCLFIRDKFYCLDMLILILKNLSDALPISQIKKNKHKAIHKGVNLTSPVTCYGDSTSSQNQVIFLTWIYIDLVQWWTWKCQELFSNLNDFMTQCCSAPFLLLFLMLFPIPMYIFLPYLFFPICFPSLPCQLASSFKFLLRHKI